MTTESIVQDFIKERKNQRSESLAQLNAFKQSKITLRRPVFFVPGWTDEDCKCWSKGQWGQLSIRQWLEDIVTNFSNAHFINFIDVTKDCKSFLDFGEVLKHKIWDLVGTDQEFDIIGHSMGGLNTRAAITQGDPLLRTNKCLTVATPHQGDHLGGMQKFLRTSWFGKMIGKSTPYHIEQGKNLDPDYEPIKIINTDESRRLFLERINRLYQFKGTRDFCVKGSAIMMDYGIEPLYKEKTEQIIVEGADHTGKIGICQDPRTILTIVKTLLDIELPRPDFNYGYIFKKNKKKNNYESTS